MQSNTSNFLSRHPWDRYVLPGFVALVWFVILTGFVPDIIHKFRKQGFNYPLAVHIHAAVYVSWLVLLTVQTVLIGSGRVGAHRRLGIFGAGLAALVVLTGLIATYVVENRMLGTPRADPAFIRPTCLARSGFSAGSSSPSGFTCRPGGWPSLSTYWDIRLKK